MRLVSVSGRVRRIRPCVRSTIGDQDHRLAGVNSGAMAPRLMMNLMPSATDMSSLVISLSGTSTRKPLVGLGVVGTNTLNTCSLVFFCTSLWSSPVRKPTEYWPARGNSTNTTCLNEDLLLGEKAALTCLRV